MQKYLEKMGEVTFEKIFNQKLGQSVYMCVNHVTFYIYIDYYFIELNLNYNVLTNSLHDILSLSLSLSFSCVALMKDISQSASR